MRCIVQKIKSIVCGIGAWANETPKSAFSTCGENVVIGPFLNATYPGRIHLGKIIYIGPHAFFLVKVA